jgi:type II secretory pathway predicted ATPase ExeA
MTSLAVLAPPPERTPSPNEWPEAENAFTPLGLSRNPFALNRESGQFVPNTAHFAVLDAFDQWRGRDDAPPLALVTGVEGAGKTRLLHELHSVVANDNTVSAAIVADAGTRRSDAQLLRQILAAFNATPTGRTGLKLQAEAREVFAAIAQEARQPLLLIDGANFAGSQLEIVRSLLTGTSLRLVLFGDTDLTDRVQRRQSLAALTGLTQRIEPLGATDVATFIRHLIDDARLDAAPPSSLIDNDAIDLVTTWSGGVPGRIVHLLHQAMLELLARGQSAIDRDIIQHVLADLAEPAPEDEAGARNRNGNPHPVVQTRIPLPIFAEMPASRQGRTRRASERGGTS